MVNKTLQRSVISQELKGLHVRMPAYWDLKDRYVKPPEVKAAELEVAKHQRVIDKWEGQVDRVCKKLSDSMRTDLLKIKRAQAFESHDAAIKAIDRFKEKYREELRSKPRRKVSLR